MKRTGPTNPYLKELISSLRERSFKENSHICLAVAERLEKPTRKKVEVNLSDIERNSDKNDFVVIPGSVLSSSIVMIFPLDFLIFSFAASENFQAATLTDF